MIKYGHLKVTRRVRKEREKLDKIVMEIRSAVPNWTGSDDDSDDHDNHGHDGHVTDSDQRNGGSRSHGDSNNESYMSDPVDSSDSESASSGANEPEPNLRGVTKTNGSNAVAEGKIARNMANIYSEDNMDDDPDTSLPRKT